MKAICACRERNHNPLKVKIKQSKVLSLPINVAAIESLSRGKEKRFIIAV